MQRYYTLGAVVLLLLHYTVWIADGLSTNPFDLGEANACAQPQGISVCNVDYEVPAAVAHQRVIAIKQGLINESSTMTGGEVAVCRTAITQVQCTRHFPRCYSSEGRVSVVYSPSTCSQVIDNCTEQVMEQGSCDFTVNASSRMCKTVSEFVSESQQPLMACNKTAEIHPLWYVTEWMFVYLRDIDEELSSLSGLDEIVDSLCLEKYFSFRCQSIGRCWDQGRRIESSPHNTQQTCQEILNCASNLIRDSFSSQLLCHLWPDMQPPSTPVTPITQATTPVNFSTNLPTSFSGTTPTSGALPQHSTSLWTILMALLITVLGYCI